MDLKKPYLGFCLGCQLLGEVVGGKVIKSKPAEIGIMDINFSEEKDKDITVLASSPITKYQIFKFQSHAYGIQFHIEIKDTTVNEWGCVPEYKKALEDQLGEGALDKFDQAAKDLSLIHI